MIQFYLFILFLFNHDQISHLLYSICHYFYCDKVPLIKVNIFIKIKFKLMKLLKINEKRQNKKES